MSRVYIVTEDHTKDFTEAAKFGEILIILTQDEMKLDITTKLDRMSEKLSRFQDDDFLVLCGDPLMMGIATYMAMFYREGRVQFLIWNKAEKKYHLELIDI